MVMKKILFLVPNLAHGGAERVLVNLVNNLNPERFDVTVQTLFDVGVNRQYLQPHVRYIPGMKYYFRGNSHVLKLFPLRWLYHRIVKEKYDIVISYLEGPTARIVSGCDDEKTILWIHTAFDSVKGASIGFRNFAEAAAGYMKYDRIIAVSADVQKAFLKYVPNITSTLVRYNTNETETIVEKAKEDVAEMGKESSVPRLCSVGKVIPVKGFDRLLSAHKRLLDEGYAHRVYILGIGEQQKELERRIAELDVQDSFILLGFQDNPYKYVAKCDLYVCSSRREGFSTAVTEALIVGTPVVSTDCSGARELLGEQNEYGLVVENSEEGIYSGMKRMLADPELLAHYRKQAQLRGHFFSREKTVQAVEEMLESL